MAGIAVDYLLVWFECLGIRSGSITALATGKDRPRADGGYRKKLADSVEKVGSLKPPEDGSVKTLSQHAAT